MSSMLRAGAAVADRVMFSATSLVVGRVAG
jgi:hypothetical protein